MKMRSWKDLTYLPRQKKKKEFVKTESQPISFDEAKKELENLIGLKTVKEQINELSTTFNF